MGKERARETACGFTLLEMLVTLVIVSRVVGILWQALAQISRIESLLKRSELQSLASQVRADWVRQALSALQAAEPTATHRFKGSPNSLEGLTTELPGELGNVFGTLKLTITFDTASGYSRLMMLPRERADALSGASAPKQGPVTLIEWPGAMGRFRYLDASGIWNDRWPREGLQDSPSLPLAVLVETGGGDIGPIFAAVRTSDFSLPRRSQLELGQ